MILRITEPFIADLELSEDVIVPITLSVGDIRDVQKKTGSFSKTIVLPGTKHNNTVLQNLYDYNVVDTFGVEKLKRCQLVDSDGLIVKDNLIFQLVRTIQKQNNNLLTDEVDYECVVKDSVADFFTKINNKELTDISDAKFTYMNHIGNKDSVISSFNNTEVDGYKYWLYNLPQPNTILGLYAFEYKDIPIAIYAKKYWDWIHAEAGYSYEWNTLSDPFVLFDKLLITDNKNQEELLKLIKEQTKIKAEWLRGVNLLPPFYSFIAARLQTSAGLNYQSSNSSIRINHYYPVEIQDPGNDLTSYNFNNVAKPTGFITSGTEVLQFTTGGINSGEQLYHTIYQKPYDEFATANIIAKLDLRLFRRITNSTSFKLYDNGETGTNRPKYEIYLTVNDLTNNVEIDNLVATIFPGDYPNFSGTSTPSDDTNFVFNETVNIEVPLVGVINTEFMFSWKVRVRPSVKNSLTDQEKFGYVNSVGLGGVYQVIDPIFRISNVEVNIFSETIIPGFTMPVKAWVPKKVKQSDFIKSIATMYNLYAVTDPNNQNNIIWKHRDNFYDEGTVLDWTQKMMKDQPQDLLFLPELVNKKLVLTYKGDDDSTNKTYIEATREIYGQQEVIFDSDFVKDVDTKELIFSPTPFGGTKWGSVLPYVDTPNVNSVRILIDGGLQNSNSYAISNVSQPLLPIQPSQISFPNTYPLTTHWSGPFGGGVLDINFGPCDFYFFSIETNKIPVQNLYNLYWRRTAAQIDKGRMLEAYFNLTNLDIATLQLDSKIKLENSYWIINKIIDFNPNDPQPTKVELLSLEESASLDTPIVNVTTAGLAPSNELKGNQLIPTLESNIKTSQVLTNETVILLSPNQTVQPGTKGFIIDENHSITNESIKFGDITIFEDHIENNGNPFNPFTYYSEGTISGIAKLETIDTDYFSTFTTEFTRISSFSNRLSTNEQAGIEIQSDNIDIILTNGINSNVFSMSLTETIMTLPSYADEADATIAGLNTGALYQTDGTGASPLNVAGIVMIKQ